MKDLTDTGLVAELRACLKDLLTYIEDPAKIPEGSGNVSLVYRVPPSPIQRAQEDLEKMRRKAEVIARARRLLA